MLGTKRTRLKSRTGIVGRPEDSPDRGPEDPDQDDDESERECAVIEEVREVGLTSCYTPLMIAAWGQRAG